MVQIPPSIRVGSTCKIEIQTPEGAKEYNSRVEDVEANHLYVATPSERGKDVEIATGAFVTLAVINAAGAMMFVEGEVVGRKAQPLSMLALRPVSIETNQQRLFHRVQVRIAPDGFWRWIGNGDPPPTAKPRTLGEDPNWQKVASTIVDLSGGGAGLLSPTELPRESWAFVRFPLPVTKEQFDARGKIMIARPRPQGDIVQYFLGMKFEGLDKAAQEKIVRANHQHQIEERRKARGL
jgi:c-di-GMP-binding flagellar brake protein YcgR